MRRWIIPFLAIALLLSLVGNFVGLGYALGQWRGERPGLSLVEGTIGAYPPELRRAIRAELAAGRADFVAGIAELRQARRAMIAALQAVPFEPAALREAQRNVAARTAALQQQVHAAMLAAAEKRAQQP
ncbi:periplasmic heavy metal sensor [Aurantimonas sp. HBX-1]|uniref:periplasmic heavy metal sensor n=1 Tax=Aurantimonas sp. HBX-1 TaxID=2906072 RepID=UPI001F2413FC|nr:periplasmic heavy metal sensor [Aurantimonas sp. HBX-1]UIJ72723.1 periplasmic heavy metal sensor [Aurantimonas sp. HBX-1]